MSLAHRMDTPEAHTGSRLAPINLDPGSVGQRDYRDLGLAQHPMGSLFTSASWIDAVVSAYGLAVGASVLQRNNQAHAAILYSEVEDIRGRRLLSLPFSDYVDPFVETAEDWRRLVDPLIAHGAPLRFRCLHNSLPGEDMRFKPAGHALWHRVGVGRSEDEMHAGLRGSARQNIRKAQRHGIVVRAGRSLEDVRKFYDLHCHVRKTKYRLFAQPFSFFEAIHAAFSAGDRIHVLLAEIDGRPIAGIFFLVHGDTLYYKFNASIDPTLGPNDLLVWTGMLMARERGLSFIDFGLSDTDQPGLVRFKQKFADTEKPISILEWRPEGYADPIGRQAGATLHRMTQILTAPEVPDAVTRAAGDELYRFFC